VALPPGCASVAMPQWLLLANIQQASYRATSEVPSVARTLVSPDLDAKMLSQHSSDTNANKLAFLLFNLVK